MLFAVRGVVVGLGFFGVVYCLLSLLVACLWQVARPFCRNSPVVSARLLFGLRIFPLIGSALITLFFALPAFALLEGGMDEDMGTLLFSAGAILLLGSGLVRIIRAQRGASRMVAEWRKGVQMVNPGAEAETLRSRHGVPPLLLYGISTPKVLVSETAIALLSRDELQAAVRHEMEHLRSRDNLKKLILHGIPFPGMRSLDRAWQEAAEFAADRAAVSNGDDAVELASALIKLCDLAPVQDAPAFTTGFVDMAALVNVRVRRLLAWKGDRSRAFRTWWCVLPILLITLPYTAAHYGQALWLTHRATEWFIH